MYKKAYKRSPLARRKKTMPIDGKTSSSLQLTKDRILIFLLFLFAAVKKKTENVFKETKKNMSRKIPQVFHIPDIKMLNFKSDFLSHSIE